MCKADRFRHTALVVLPYLTVAVLYTALYVAWRDRLPKEVAVHFGAGMEADGFGTPDSLYWPAITVLAGMGAMFGAMRCFARMPLEARRLVYPLSYGVATLMGYLFVGVLVLQLDLDSAQGVRLKGGHVVAGLLATAVAALVGLLLANVGPPDPEPERRDSPVGSKPRLSVPPGQQVSWTRSVATGTVAVLTVGSMALSGVLVAALASWPVAIPILLVSFLPLAFVSVRVTVDPRGVLIAFGRFGRLGRTISLERITGARSQDVSPLRDFHGWGYRITPTRSGLVTRAGEALTVELAGGREFVVTVDDSRTAAALLNTLIDHGKDS